MEILSIGEKIRRARIYKGYTLKDICEDKISVSKMSCIENDKVKPEEWILEFISSKLELELNYLKDDIRWQIKENINELENTVNKNEYEKEIEYNLSYADKFGYYDLSFQLMHMLVSYYFKYNKLENMQVITAKYYEVCQKSKSTENQMIYYMDMAKYLYLSEEYLEAANYFNNVRKYSKELKDFKTVARATYNEAACFVMVENFQRAYEIIIKIEELMNYFEKDVQKAEAYQMLAMLSLRMGKGEFELYEKKAYEYYGDDTLHKSEAMYNFGVIMFSLGMNKRALEYITLALDNYPRDNKETLVDFMLLVVDELVENNVLKKSQEICDEALNIAIFLDNVKYIEKAYYFKSVILQKSGEVQESEIYMNLSLDALQKFGNKNEIYKRYMEMGEMYYKLNNVNDSIKYFDLAIKIKNKI